MKNIVLILNIVVSLIIIGLILMQGKGAGLGSAWGGAGEMFQTRRGVEKIVLKATIAVVVIFFAISVYNLFLK